MIGSRERRKNLPAILCASALAVSCLDLMYIYHNYCIFHKLLPLIFDRHRTGASQTVQAILLCMKFYF